MPSELACAAQRGSAPTAGYAVRWQPLAGPDQGAIASAAKVGAAQAARPWLILLDASGVGDAVAQVLAVRREASVRIPRRDRRACTVTDGGVSEADDLRRTLEQRAGECRGVLLLWPLDAAPGGDEISAGAGCLAALLGVVQALALVGGAHPPRLWVVTRGAGSVTAREPGRAAQAAVWGLGRVIATEHPELWGGLVDLDPSGRTFADARNVCDAIAAGGAEDQQAYRAGVLYGARLVSLPDAPHGAALGPQLDDAETACVVAAQRGPAAAWLARALARRRVRRIGVLVPDGQAAGTRSAIADHGARDLRSEVRPVDDVAPESWAQGLRGLSDALERRPAVLFWLPRPAGVGSGVLLQQETARFVARFRELVAPASALLDAARAQAIERVVLLSCDGVVPGSPGRGAETAAAAFVEGLARGGPEIGRVAVVSAALEVDDDARASAHADVAVWRRLGIAAPAPANVLHALQEAATSDPAFVSLLAIDWPRHARAVYGGVVPALLSCVIAGAPTAAAAQAGHLAARLAQAAPSQRMDVALGYLQELLADVLEDMPLEVDADRGLFELGLDSLGLLQLKTRLQLALDRAIPVTAAFNHPTPRALARHLIEDVCGHGVCGRSPGERTRAAEPALPSMLDEIEALSDEEAASLLREALA